jgi:hypothetical protein
MALHLKPGGKEGGDTLFLGSIGLFLTALGLWFLFDSVHVRGDGAGALSGWIGGGSGRFQTTSMGIIFVPFFISVVILFYDATKKWSWGLFWIGLAIIAIEILSRIRFEFSMKTTHLLLILGMVAAGAGLMIRAYRTDSSNNSPPPDQPS